MRKTLLVLLLCLLQPLPARAQAAATPEAPGVDPRAAREKSAESQLRGVFSRVQDFERIRVSVANGVARLEGSVASSEAREKAEQLAARTHGVIYVDNAIVGEDVSSALARLREFGNKLTERAPLYGIALAVLLLALVLARALAHSERLGSRWVPQRIMRGIVRQLVAGGVALVGILIALELLQATALVGAVLGAAGVAGIAVGFAFRDIAENYLASVLLGLRRPFEANDLVLVAGHEGKVIRLTLRETILMSLDGNHVRLPNAQVFKSVIVNFTKNPLRRLSFKAGIGVEENLADAQRLGVGALRETPGVCADPGPFTRIEELADSTVVVQYFAWVDQRSADWYKVRSEALRRVKAALDAAGVAMPVPTYRLESGAGVPTGERGRRELGQAAHEVAPDDVLERQMEDDRGRDRADDLLEEDGASGRDDG